MVVCLVKGCHSSTKNNPLKITFHRIPKTNYNHWARILNVSGNPFENKHKLVCSLHFEDDCFDRTGQTTRLRDYAIPTLLLSSDCLIRCLICLQMVEDPSSMSSLDKLVTVQDNMNFSIFDLIYSIANVKLEVKQNVFNICPTCVNGVVHAFKYQQLCVNAGQHQFKQLNAQECDVNVETTPNIRMEKVKEESVEISETFISCGIHDEDSSMFVEEMESPEIEIKFEPTMEHISEEAESMTQSLPLKAQACYEKAYDDFEKWRIEQQFNSCSEKVLLMYIKELSKKLKPSSLCGIISLLKATIKTKSNVDISIYGGIQSFMQQYANGYTPKKVVKILTSQQIYTFIAKADDYTYLFTKVAVIMGVSGGCRKSELLNLKISEIYDSRTHFLVTLHDSSAKEIRSFVIPPSFYGPVRKYIDLRPTDLDTQRFFIQYLKGKCIRQVVGIIKLAAVPKKVAEFLKLPNPELYNWQALRRSVTTYNFNTTLGPTKVNLDDIQVPKEII